MAIPVLGLTKSDIEGGETRLKIHKLTGEPGGPTLQERERFATSRGERNVTKYWSLQTVLAACDLWHIYPELNKGGRYRVRRAGGLSFSTPEPKAPEEPKEVKSDSFAKPPVTVGGGNRTPFSTENGTKVPKYDTSDSEEERARKRAKLEAIIDEMVTLRVNAAVQRDDQVLKDLIAGTAQATAGAVLDTKAGALLEALRVANDAYMAQVRDLIQEARPVVLKVQVPSGEQRQVTGKVHRSFKWVLQLAMARKNIALIGPTGCGKTHMMRQVAEALGLPFATISCTMGQSESKLIGGLLPLGDGGKFVPYVSDFVRLFRDGGLFLLDEFDSIDPNVGLILNQALANGRIDLPVIGTVERHKDFVCAAALNTYGTGASRDYVGRTQLDEASLDRFRLGQVEMDYDRDLEKDLVGPVTGYRDQDWLRRAWHIRDAITRNGIRRTMSTRFIVESYDLLAAGATIQQIETAFSSGWSPDELQKVGITRVALF